MQTIRELRFLVVLRVISKDIRLLCVFDFLIISFSASNSNLMEQELDFVLKWLTIVVY